MRPYRDEALTPEIVVGHGPGQVGSAYLEDEVMLLSIDQGRYYNLNSVGARIWKLIESPRTIADLCQCLERDFDVSPEQCRTDVVELVSRLVDEGLAVIVRP